MGRKSSFLFTAAVTGIVVILSILLARAAAPCCFTNGRYEGVCKVTPAKGETCQDILDYLNNPVSVGKSYCGGTTLRGGWSVVDCVKGK